MMWIFYILGCLPYAWLSMLGDVCLGSMLGYLLSAALLVLVWRRLGWRSLPCGIVGGVLSVLLAAWVMSEKGDFYFKPFAPQGLALAVSLAALLGLILACGIRFRNKGGKDIE